MKPEEFQQRLKALETDFKELYTRIAPIAAGRNADQIVVLNKGQITETGTHEELTAKRGEYFELVKNQLELGN